MKANQIRDMQFYRACSEVRPSSGRGDSLATPSPAPFGESETSLSGEAKWRVTSPKRAVMAWAYELRLEASLEIFLTEEEKGGASLLFAGW